MDSKKMEAASLEVVDAAISARLNSVQLTGRMAAGAEERVLPSGDVVATFRIIVDRPKESSGRQRVDVIDCAAWSGRLRRHVMGWREGDVVAVEGALRRRFFHAGGRTLSRSEVEVDRGRRVSRRKKVAMSD